MIESLNNIKRLRENVYKVFGSNKYYKDIKMRSLHKKQLLGIINEINLIYNDLEKVNCNEIEKRFNDIYNALIGITSVLYSDYASGKIEFSDFIEKYWTLKIKMLQYKCYAYRTRNLYKLNFYVQ